MDTQQQEIKILDIIGKYIQDEIGGLVCFLDDRFIDTIIIRVKFFDENNKVIDYFDKAISYTEITKVIDPILIGKSFVENYKQHKKY